MTLVRIQNFRCFADLKIEPLAGLNVIVGENESGKSTILQALTVALTARWNGQWVTDELTSEWFHRPAVLAFFDERDAGGTPPLPEIDIELHVDDPDDQLQRHRGAYNSLGRDAVGLRLRISPSEEFADEIEEYFNASDCPRAMPVEYFEARWRNFADESLTRRPTGFGHVLIDSRTISSQRGVDYHTRQMLQDFIEPRERAAISIAHRSAREQISTELLEAANERIGKDGQLLADRDFRLAFDQSTPTGWHTSITPRIDEIPLSLSGQGVQAAIKIALAMSRTADGTSFVLAEEPENHLSHSRLMRLVASMEGLAGSRQCFVTTHSSFVLNRLRLDRLLLLGASGARRLTELDPDTVRYFQKLSGFDTLRLVLADQLVLVEGPSDELVFARFYQDRFGSPPQECGVDVVSLGGVTLRRSLELCAALGRGVIAMRDNDGKDPEHWVAAVEEFLEAGVRELLVGQVDDGTTLEYQLLSANGENTLRSALGIDVDRSPVEWMLTNKTEAALRVLEASESLTPPQFMTQALDMLADK